MAATRWLTFDCYGTIADWNSCMLSALEPVAGAQADALLGRVPPGRVHPRGRAAVAPVPGHPHRRARAGRRAERGRAARPGPRARWSTAWPGMAIFPDVDEALADLVRSGWRLGVLTNCDDDLFETTSEKLPAPVEVVVTAQQVRSYKPDLAHFRRFAELTDATSANWIHVANSWVHDVLPAARMGLRSVWVDRDRTGHPAKFAERRITAMRRLPETVLDVSVLPAWSLSGRSI